MPSLPGGIAEILGGLRVKQCCVAEGGGCLAGFMNAKKEFPRQTFAFCVDGLSSIIGSFMGTSPIAAFIESASGIREGGRYSLFL